MLLKGNYTAEHINELRKKTGADPSILERTVFAFGLLEAISKAGMSFIFKGGTSLLILLEHPKRLSTDIDIIVKPGTDIDRYISIILSIITTTNKIPIIFLTVLYFIIDSPSIYSY